MHPYLHVFGLTLPTFGLMMSLGMLAAFALLFVLRRFTPFTEDTVYDIAIWAILAGFLGSKILYWITELDTIIANPREILNMLTSGLVFYGSLIGGVGGVFLYCKKKRLPFFRVMDYFIPAVTLGQAFGRIGCFFAGCCYGAPTDGPIHCIFPAGSSAPAGIPLVPTQLLESGFLFLLTVLLCVLVIKRRPAGAVLGRYGILYGLWRFIIEFYRADPRGAVGVLSTSQFIGLFVITLGLLLTVLVKKNRLKDTAPDPLPSDKALEEALRSAETTSLQAVTLPAEQAAAEGTKPEADAAATEEASVQAETGKDADAVPAETVDKTIPSATEAGPKTKAE